MLKFQAFSHARPPPHTERTEEPGAPDWSQDDTERPPLASDNAFEELRRKTEEQEQAAKDLAEEVRAKVLRFRQADKIVDYVATATLNGEVTSLLMLWCRQRAYGDHSDIQRDPAHVTIKRVFRALFLIFSPRQFRRLL